jgi:hypothetical protein
MLDGSASRESGVRTGRNGHDSHESDERGEL